MTMYMTPLVTCLQHNLKISTSFLFITNSKLQSMPENAIADSEESSSQQSIISWPFSSILIQRYGDNIFLMIAICDEQFIDSLMTSLFPACSCTKRVRCTPTGSRLAIVNLPGFFFFFRLSLDNKKLHFR